MKNTFLTLVLLVVGISFTSFELLNAQNYNVSYQNYYDDAPTAIIRVNFHFYSWPLAGGGYSNYSQQDAQMVAEKMVEFANLNLEGLIQANRKMPNGQFPPHVPKAKFKFELYNGWAGNTFLYSPGQTYSNRYNGTVYDIVFEQGNVDPTMGGCSNTGGVNVSLCNIRVMNDDSIRDRSRVLCHEMCHTFGLAHTYECSNECAGIDIAPTAEECISGCVFGPTTDCLNKNYGNNILSYGGSNPSRAGITDLANVNNALTPCQWEQIFEYFLNIRPAYLYWQNCNDYANLVIPTGQEQVWADARLITKNIIVEQGAKLTVKDLLMMGGSCCIYVKRGGRLIIDGATITKLCSEKWGDIYVWGNTNEEQPLPTFNIVSPSSSDWNKAGVVNIINGATIEESYNALSNSARDDGSLSWNDLVQNRGGVINAKDCIFQFNNRSAEFISYRSPSDPIDGLDKSKFENCTFETGYFGVTMWDVNGVTFEGCTFNNHPQEAILAWDASPHVINACQFNNNYYGINLYSTYFSSATTRIGSSNTAHGINAFNNNHFNLRAYGASGIGRLEIFRSCFKTLKSKY